MTLKRIGKSLAIVIIILFIILFSGCSQKHVKVDREIKDLQISLSEINPDEIFSTKPGEPNPKVLTATDGKKYIGYTLDEHKKIEELSIKYSSNYDTSLILAQKYNLAVNQINEANILYRLEQQKSIEYEILWRQTEEELEKERFWNNVEVLSMKAIYVLTIVAMIAAAL